MSPLSRIAALSLLLLLLWLPVNLWASIDWVASLIAFAPILFGIAILLISLLPLSSLRNPRVPLWLSLLFVVMGLGLTIASPPFVAWKPQFRLFRLPLYDWLLELPFAEFVGQTIHANVLAGALLLFLPFAAVYTLWPYRDTNNALALFTHPAAQLLIALSMSALLILTQSRGAYLGLISALGIVFILRWLRLLFVALLGVPVAIGAIYWLGPQRVFELLGADSTFGGSQFRIEAWANALRALRDFFFTGIGPGMFDRVIPLLYPYSTVESTEVPHAHNLILQVGVDLGVPGLLAWLVLLATVLTMTIRVLRHTERTSINFALAAACLAALVGMLVHGLLDAVTWSSKLAFIPWLIYAQIVLLYRAVFRDRAVESYSTDL